MDCYEILGVDKDASMEELKKAYEKRIKKIENEVANKKNADAFLRVLENAYKEALFNLATSSKSEQTIENTVMFTQEELEKIKSDEIGYELCYDEEPYEGEEYDYEDYRQEKTKKNKKKRSSSKSKKSKDDSRKNNNKKYDRKKGDERDKDKVENKPDRREKDKESYNKESNIFLLPFKIIAFPIMIVLSVIIFILRFIDAIIWIATKILIVASIAGASIYGYEVYRGGVIMDVRIFGICGGVFVLSAILPYITRTVPDSLDLINTSIKNFIYK